MLLNRFSRHRFSLGYKDDDGTFFLGDRVPFPYRDVIDNIQHIVRTGDSLFNLPARHYTGMVRPSGLWWIIADFQPDPIQDPTIRLTEGTIIVIPSLRTVQQEILNDRRKRTPE
jgi:hypothetical protein